MPIESLADRFYSTKSDSFALGVLIYYLVTRRFPWKGKNKE
jgi:serine/threonine protein kinase